MSDLIGSNLGPYRIVAQLGLGGMATVYKAYQPSMDRYVAIKVLPHHFAQDPTFAGRFQQEARVIARLEHARILPVYDYGEDQGATYIVMRCLEAGTLADRMQDGPLPLEEAVRIISQVAEALDYAHRQGIVHRDIKPANIMLDASGDVFLTDFGIAKLVEGSVPFTGSAIVGTPAYIAPEQGMGQGVDYRSDIYSLGVVLYQMATGDVPYHAETPMAVVIKHIYEPLPLPRSVNPDVPEAVERVILKAMAKDPEGRYQSGQALADALRQAVVESSAAASGLATAQPSSETIPGAAATGRHAPGAAAAPTGPAAPTHAIEPPPAASTPQAGRKPGWVLPAAITGAVIAVGVAVLVTSRLLGGSPADAPATPLPPADQATQAAPQTPTDPLPEWPEGMACGPGQRLLLAHTFDDEPFPNLPPELVRAIGFDGGTAKIDPPQGQPVMLPFGPEAADTLLMVRAQFPDPRSHLGLAVRRTREQFYTADYAANGEVALARQDVHLADANAGQPLDDGQMHLLVFEAKAGQMAAYADGQLVAKASDPEPLPAGQLTLRVEGAPVVIDAVVACAYEGAAPPGDGPVLFEDDFRGSTISDRWTWVDEPPAWRLEDGLVVEIAPESGFNLTDPSAPAAPLHALVIPAPQETFSLRTDLAIQPTQNYQAAGLVVLSRTGRPLFSLMRGYCAPDSADGCAGDGIFFDNWLPVIRNRAGGHASSGGGQMPPEGKIALRMVLAEREMVGYYSLDSGQTWEAAGSFPLLDIGDERIGWVGLVVSSGGQPVRPIPVYFGRFVVTEEAQ